MPRNPTMALWHKRPVGGREWRGALAVTTWRELFDASFRECIDSYTDDPMVAVTVHSIAMNLSHSPKRVYVPHVVSIIRENKPPLHFSFRDRIMVGHDFYPGISTVDVSFYLNLRTLDLLPQTERDLVSVCFPERR
jgi:hypothetical protein